VNPILWGTTTRSFIHGKEFCKFMRERATIQRHFLRKLHLEVEMLNQRDWVLSAASRWNRIIKEPILKKFRALEVLHVDIKDPYFTHAPLEFWFKAGGSYVLYDPCSSCR
jgi:hypothetical protein